jgi:hypothetical protein
MIIRFLFVICGCILSGCALSNEGSTRYRLYQLHDMEESLQDHYANVLRKISPGLACGDFKNTNTVGCFKLLLDTTHGKVVKLIYHDLPNGDKFELYEFTPPTNDVLIEKIYESKLTTSNALEEHEEVVLDSGQPSLRLIFFEKSAVVFYWKNAAFHKIWTAD